MSKQAIKRRTVAASPEMVLVGVDRPQMRCLSIFIVGKEHIGAQLAETADGGFVCDPDQSRVIASGAG